MYVFFALSAVILAALLYVHWPNDINLWEKTILMYLAQNSTLAVDSVYVAAEWTDGDCTNARLAIGRLSNQGKIVFLTNEDSLRIALPS